MYSVVLMVAMTGGTDVPAGFFHHGCCGGCEGNYATCTGWSCNGGYSCHGCWGGHAHSHSCHGCYGSCYGYSCHGCWGGHAHSHSCHGCWGGYSCYGSCYGNCYGNCYGYSCHGGHGGWFGHHRHHEECCPVCDTCNTCYGGSCIGAPVAPGAPATMPVPGEKLENKPVEKKSELNIAAPATLVVSLPADAKLLIDDAATTSTSGRRVFVSPALQTGREYTYSLKAEYTKDGKSVVVNKDITVTAGAEIAVTMEEGLAGVASR
jgi:uncharacterized protein (TIGR03000 family)